MESMIVLTFKILTCEDQIQRKDRFDSVLGFPFQSIGLNLARKVVYYKWFVMELVKALFPR